MAVSVKASGTWRTLAQAYARVSSVWKPVDVYVKIGGIWTLVSQLPLSATVSSTSAGGSAPAPGAAQTANVTASGHDGSGTYTYAWEYVSGDASVSCVNQTSATTYWLRSSGSAGTFNAVWRCKVTDANGYVYAASVNVSIVLTP